MSSKIQEGSFCRVRNRVDLVGKVVKTSNHFVCLDIPGFKGDMQYPQDFVEFINE